MKNISSRKFVFCNYYKRDVPNEGSGCCEFYNGEDHKCDYEKYSISSREDIIRESRLSERDDIISEFLGEEGSNY